MIRTLTGSLCSAAVASSAHRHLEAAVADDRPDLLVGLRELRADGGREAVAHRAGAARRQPVAVLGGAAELRRPHLVLADVGGEDAVAPAQRVEPIEHVLRAQAALLGVLERELLAPARRSA